MKTLKKIAFAIVSVYRVHFSLNSIVVVLVIAAVIYKFFLRDMLVASGQVLNDWFDPSSVWQVLLLGVVASILAAFVFGLLGTFLLGWWNKMRLTGKYDAYEIDDSGTEIPWGTVTVSYHPMSTSTHHTPVKLHLAFGKGNDSVELEGDGIIIDNRYLSGHYAEVGKPERRRSGSFIYEIDGDGKVWSGPFIAVSPSASSPTQGRAKWVRK